MALQMAAQLRQQARDHALDQLVAGQHALGLGFEMRGGELPEAGLRLAAESHAETGAQLGQVRRVRRVGVAHLLEQGQLESGAQGLQRGQCLAQQLRRRQRAPLECCGQKSAGWMRSALFSSCSAR